MHRARQYMRLHRFYISEPVGLQTEITVHSADLANQVRRVFRLKQGDSLIVFDGSGSDYECRIAEFAEESVTLNITTSERSRFMPARNVYLCAAVVKKDTFEWIVEKATELGVTHIIPVMADRSEKKSLNEARLRKIAIEASEQSGRGDVPEIAEILTLEKCVELLRGEASERKAEITLVALHTESDFSPRPRLGGIESAGLFIGPEGGWSPEEIELFHRREIPLLCLGKQVLRAETAVIAALSQVVFDVNQGFTLT